MASLLLAVTISGAATLATAGASHAVAPITNANLWAACKEAQLGVPASASLFGQVPTCKMVPIVDPSVGLGSPYPFDPTVLTKQETNTTPVVKGTYLNKRQGEPVGQLTNCSTSSASIAHDFLDSTTTSNSVSAGVQLGFGDLKVDFSYDHTWSRAHSETQHVSADLGPWTIGDVYVSRPVYEAPGMLKIDFKNPVEGHWHWYAPDPVTGGAVTVDTPTAPPTTSAGGLWNTYTTTARVLLPRDLAEQCGHQPGAQQPIQAQIFNKWATEYSQPSQSWCLTDRGTEALTEPCDIFTGNATNIRQYFDFFPVTGGLQAKYLVGDETTNTCLSATPGFQYLWKECNTNDRNQKFLISPVGAPATNPEWLPLQFEMQNDGTSGCLNNWAYGANNPWPTSPGKYGDNNASCDNTDDRMTWTTAAGQLPHFTTAQIGSSVVVGSAVLAGSRTVALGSTSWGVTVSGNNFPALPLIEVLDASGKVLKQHQVQQLAGDNFNVIWKRTGDSTVLPGEMDILPPGASRFRISNATSNINQVLPVPPPH